ncbi:MAG: polysaccharide deacetylase family protein [Legionellaceae bacterium]|nr:polysaccharide deacetylase family protein [Legionellaceae bacterium]
MKIILPAVLVLSLIMVGPSFAIEREIAITIDDLPFVGTNSNNEGNLRRTHKRFMSILTTLKENNVPATGFIIANSIGKGQWALLEEFRNEGFELGNHTYSHENLNRLSASRYIDNIAKADKILQPVMTKPKYFRYPYLAEGKGVKKQEVLDYLAANDYIVAPVTVDSKDYKFNARFLNISWRVRNQYLNKIKQQYLAYIWKQTLKAERNSKDNTKQILLIHANLLNSHCLGDIIAMYKKHGYKFITLGEALQEDIQPDVTPQEIQASN